MAYISTDDVKKIRNALKTEMPEYKFSAVSYTHLTLPTRLMG